MDEVNNWMGILDEVNNWMGIMDEVNNWMGIMDEVNNWMVTIPLELLRPIHKLRVRRSMVRTPCSWSIRNSTRDYSLRIRNHVTVSTNEIFMAFWKEDDEDYWNESDTKSKAKAFNFEEDELAPSCIMSMSQYGSQLCGVLRSGAARLGQQVRAGMDSRTTPHSTDSLAGSFSKGMVLEGPEISIRPLDTLISDEALRCSKYYNTFPVHSTKYLLRSGEPNQLLALK
uniref:Uncharacterized protein n=1 Tax=Timema monikensis TaxID=170555 RepID=A0A7R9EIA9_9NEOP|nr:unnamed protein product [Timema monikensis]